MVHWFINIPKNQSKCFLVMLFSMFMHINTKYGYITHDLWDVRKHAAAIRRKKSSLDMLDGPMVSDKIRDLDGPFHCSIAKNYSKFTFTIVVVSIRLSTELLQKVTWLVFDDFPKYISIRVTVAIFCVTRKGNEKMQVQLSYS